MINANFSPNLSNPNTVLGVIYMTSHMNVYTVIDVVSKFLKLKHDDVVYRYLIDVIAYHCDASPLKFISRLLDVVTKENKEFLVNIVNNEAVVKAVKSASLNRNHFDREAATVIARKIQTLMNNDNVLKILQGNVSQPIFVTFGYHPAIANDVELQKKWILTIASDPLYVIRSVPWYITDEALEAASTNSLYKVIKFIEEFFGEEYNLTERKALFTSQTLRKIVALYIVSENSSHGEKLLGKIKRYESKNLFGKP